MNSAMVKVLLVVDTAGIRQPIATALEKAGYNVTEMRSGSAALESATTFEYGIIVTAVQLQTAMTGLYFLERLNRDARGPVPPAIMVSRLTQSRFESRFEKCGIVDWIVTSSGAAPWGIVAAVERALAITGTAHPVVVRQGPGAVIDYRTTPTGLNGAVGGQAIASLA